MKGFASTSHWKKIFPYELSPTEKGSKSKMSQLPPLKVYPVMLTVKGPNKNCGRPHFIFYFYPSEKIRLDVSAEDSHEISSLIFSEKQ